MYEENFPNKRFKHTIEFLEKHISKENEILDLGVPNPFSKIMNERGFLVQNTKGEDLDTNYSTVSEAAYSVTTAFEIFEHLLAPFNVLRELKSDQLVA